MKFIATISSTVLSLAAIQLFSISFFYFSIAKNSKKVVKPIIKLVDNKTIFGVITVMYVISITIIGINVFNSPNSYLNLIYILELIIFGYVDRKYIKAKV